MTQARKRAQSQPCQHAGILYVLKPVIDAAAPVTYAIEVNVAAGQPVALRVEGEGYDALAAAPMHLGQTLPPFDVLLVDDAGALAPMCDAAWHEVALVALRSVCDL